MFIAIYFILKDLVAPNLIVWVAPILLVSILCFGIFLAIVSPSGRFPRVRVPRGVFFRLIRNVFTAIRFLVRQIGRLISTIYRRTREWLIQKGLSTGLSTVLSILASIIVLAIII